MQKLFLKLDLDEYLKTFNSYFAREKSIFMEGDTSLHFKFINELKNAELSTLPFVKNLDTELIHLTKNGVLHIEHIFEFVKIVNFVKNIKAKKLQGKVGEWLENIIIPPEILTVISYFDKDGTILEKVDERFLAINSAQQIIKEKIKTAIKNLYSSQKLSSYLVDRQVHFLNNQEAILVRGGFNHVLKGTIVGRSSTGYFYVVPEILDNFKKQEAALIDKKEELIYEYAKKISQHFAKNYLFLKFVNKEFDRLDHYIARILFAKSKNMEFILPEKNKKIKLVDFSHPALNDPKPLNIEFNESILLVTGVNAGGKTMLLKSILSSVILSKYLLPMKINPTHSSIGSFKGIEAIIEDPQNVKDDISTFAGRMVQFSKLFGKNNILVGVDEIELGTDADEAANLFCAVLETLIKQDIKLVITTHHKRLASMLASNPKVELLAALYDEKAQKPTFKFLKGTIGKSYAFETAERYGIMPNIIKKARELYGEDKEKLNELIQKNIDLELKMRSSLEEISQKELKLNKLSLSLEVEKNEQITLFNNVKNQFEKEYKNAITLVKDAIKIPQIEQKHRLLNEAYIKKVEAENKVPIKHKNENLNIGDIVKYGTLKGTILQIKKDIIIIDINGISMRLPKNTLEKTEHTKSILQQKHKGIVLQKPRANSGVVLDLHGLRADEAVDELDKFLSDALISGFDEIQIFHGIGTGKLAFAVKNFLKSHPSVKSFFDAPANQGGFGATIVRL